LFLHLVALAIALIALSFQTHDWFVLSFTGILVFFTSAMLAHRTLYEARPAPAYLTEFYLWMSFGGALGGMFTALVAPRIFTEIYEYPLLLALSMACRPGALRLPSDPEKRKDELAILWLLAAGGILAVLWLPTLIGNMQLQQSVQRLGPAPLVIAVLTAVMVLNVKFPARQLVTALLMCLAICTIHSNVRKADSLVTDRSFFGVYRVQRDLDETGTFKVLMHGTTLHG
jgi:hypothetical protein